MGRCSWVVMDTRRALTTTTCNRSIRILSPETHEEEEEEEDGRELSFIPLYTSLASFLFLFLFLVKPLKKKASLFD